MSLEFERVITANWGDDSVRSLAGYEAKGGYEGLRPAPDLALDSPAFGPQPPDRADLYAAQDAPLRVDLSDAEYDRL